MFGPKIENQHRGTVNKIKMWITILIQSRVLNAAYPPVHREKGEGQGRADHHNYIPFSCKKHLILKEVPPPFFLGACKNVM